MISKHIRSILKVLSAVGCVSATQPATSSPLAQFKNAAVTARIATELNQQNISEALKAALIENARPEDSVAIKSLLARYKRLNDLKFDAVFSQLIATRNGGETEFTVETDFDTPGRFVINGREWKIPPKGSVLNALNRVVYRETKSRSANMELFFPKAFGDVATSPAIKLAAYVFVSAHGNPNRWEDRHDASNYLSKKDVFDVLLRGSDFPQTTTGEKIKSFLDVMMMAPIKVQCTPEGAKGFALVAGSEVEFLAQDDLSVILKSKGNDQALKFTTTSNSLILRSAEIRKALAQVKPSKDDEDVTKLQSAAAKLALENLNKLCDLRGMPPASSRTVDFCQKVRALELRVKTSSLWRSVARPDQDEGWNLNNRARLAANAYVTETAIWLEENRSSVNERLEELAGTLIVKDETGTISACADRACSKTIPANPDSVYGYRIPPNQTEDSVKKAIGFKPRSSPKSKAEIRYSCPTKNQACKRVELINGEDLSGEDIVIAQTLVESANNDLEWKESHKTVSQPVSILRALAPCCKDTKCRATVIEKGANLIPTNGTKSDGVAQ